MLVVITSVSAIMAGAIIHYSGVQFIWTDNYFLKVIQ